MQIGFQKLDEVSNFFYEDLMAIKSKDERVDNFFKLYFAGK